MPKMTHTQLIDHAYIMVRAHKTPDEALAALKKMGATTGDVIIAYDAARDRARDEDDPQ